MTCFAFSVNSFDDFDTFKADFGTAETASGLFGYLGLLFSCANSGDSLVTATSSDGVTITTPVEVTDELLAEIVAANTCSADSTGCWVEDFNCY